MPTFLVTHLDTQDSLPQEDVTASGVDVVVAWVTGVDHESVGEFHGLGTLSSQFSLKLNIYINQGYLIGNKTIFLSFCISSLG